MGDEYPIKSDADSEYLQELAKYVEERIMHVTENTELPPYLKPEVLAALLIADDYFVEKKKNEEIDRKIEQLTTMMEKRA
jgi:cell division protein ZapA (FtsZ GTPase activity inhibitor)